MKPKVGGAKVSPDEHCQLCGRACLAERARGEVGFCGAGREVGFSNALLHHGEEPPLSGPRLGPAPTRPSDVSTAAGPGLDSPLDPDDSTYGGSGTIFFTRCVLRCVFCQNWQISQAPAPASQADAAGQLKAGVPALGREISAEELADIMLELEAQGAFNINLVSPTPYVPQIALALNAAKKRGLALPIVYNSGGYDSLTALKIMDGLVDVYLPDAKMAPPDGVDPDEPDSLSARLLGVGDYPKINRLALREMYRQVGPLRLDGHGLATKGFLVRHLVLPDNLARTTAMLPWLADTFGPTVHLSLMAQYHPTHLVVSNPDEFRSFPGLGRHLSLREYEDAVDLALNCGLTNAFIQELSSAPNYLPDFKRPKVFHS